jgi:hypothetical protein
LFPLVFQVMLFIPLRCHSMPNLSRDKHVVPASNALGTP